MLRRKPRPAVYPAPHVPEPDFMPLGERCRRCPAEVEWDTTTSAYVHVTEEPRP